MIYPSIDEITKGEYNRYTLVIAAAKCARVVTEENLENREQDKEVPSEKAVKTAIKRLYSGEYAITETPEDVDVKLAEEAQRQREIEAAKEAAEARTIEVGNFALNEDMGEDEISGDEDSDEDGEDDMMDRPMMEERDYE